MQRNYKPSWAAVLLPAAAAAGATALYNIFQARKTEREHPPTGRFVTVDGMQLHYLDEGQGPPVVLLHGNIVSSADFARSGVLGLIARRHRVIAFDRPGFGYSDRSLGSTWSARKQADLLRHAFAAVGIERPVVLGHSYGAVVALELALNRPHGVSGLVLVSGYYYPTLRADTLMSLPGAIPIIGGLIRHTVSPLLSAASMPSVVNRMFAPCPVPTRFAKRAVNSLSRRPEQIRAQSQDGVTMVLAAATMHRRYRDLTMPVAIIAGRDDKVVDVTRHAMRLHREIAHSTLSLVPDAGHMVHYMVPELVAASVGSGDGRANEAGDSRSAEAAPAV